MTGAQLMAGRPKTIKIIKVVYDLNLAMFALLRSYTTLKSFLGLVVSTNYGNSSKDQIPEYSKYARSVDCLRKCND